MSLSNAPLKFLHPGWFTMVLGLGGLSLAWHRAEALMGEMAAALALVCGALAAAVFAALLVGTLLRLQRHPEAWAEDLRHPVRHALVAALPIATMLLGTVVVALLGDSLWAQGLWWAGSLGLVLVSLWVLTRWWQPKAQGGLQWAVITPALFIPIVGNVLAPLGGVPLGHAPWASAQLGVGVLFWPVVWTLLMARLLVQGAWPERLLPMNLIFVAPPAVVGLALHQLGAPERLVWALWGMAVFVALWVASLAPRLRELPFSVPHWGLSFPMTALAALTLTLASPGSPLAVLGPVLLALSSLIILALLMATWRGLRAGTLLAPEPVASIVPVSA